jgi:hypothetical protein
LNKFEFPFSRSLQLAKTFGVSLRAIDLGITNLSPAELRVSVSL